MFPSPKHKKTVVVLHHHQRVIISEHSLTTARPFLSVSQTVLLRPMRFSPARKTSKLLQAKLTRTHVLSSGLVSARKCQVFKVPSWGQDVHRDEGAIARSLRREVGVIWTKKLAYCYWKGLCMWGKYRFAVCNYSCYDVKHSLISRTIKEINQPYDHLFK